jgi:hypothetical protein
MTRQFSSVVSRTPGGGPELSDPYAPTENGWSNWHLPSTGVPWAMTAPTSSSITRPPTSAKALGAAPGWAARCDARFRARSRDASKYGFARSRAAFAFSRAKSGGADEALAEAATINTAAATANERSSFVRELWCTDFKSGPPARDVHHGGDSAQSKTAAVDSIHSYVERRQQASVRLCRAGTRSLRPQRPVVGESHFPKYTVRLLGRLIVSDAGLSWRPWAPWRKPRLVEVSGWRCVSSTLKTASS